jgi:hypothetical protein
MKVPEDLLPHAAAGGGRATGQNSRLRRGQFPPVMNGYRNILFKNQRD